MFNLFFSSITENYTEIKLIGKLNGVKCDQLDGKICVESKNDTIKPSNFGLGSGLYAMEKLNAKKSQYYLVGIASDVRIENKQFGVYTKADTYIEWILDNMYSF